MDDIATSMAAYAGSLRFEAIPADVIHAAKQHLIDSLGCAIGGRNCDAARMAQRVAERGAPAARMGRILGSKACASAESAAFINTSMIRYLDFNDTVHGGHPSDALGAVIAIADAAQADGKRLLSALVVTYEIAVRLITSMRLRERGFDQGMAIGIAAACGVGHMLNLAAEKIAHAIAITAVANVPLRVTRVGQLSLWKGAATAFAARNGVFAALLAAEGMTGPETAFTGRNGVFEQVSGDFTLAPFGADHLTPRVGFKFWPVENGAQAAVWAARELRKGAAPDDIASLEIATSRATWSEIGSGPEKWDPRTRETADHSLPYIFARAWVDGGITVASFDRAAYLDPALRPLMAKITVRQDHEIERLFPAHVMMRVSAQDKADGTRTIEVADPRGHPANLMSDGEVAEKFLGLAGPALGRPAAAAVLERLWRIDREERAAALFDRLEQP